MTRPAQQTWRTAPDPRLRDTGRPAAPAATGGTGGTLWDPAPSRCSAPQTHRQASAAIKRKNHACALRVRVWQAVMDRPGATAAELAQALGADGAEVLRLLLGLEHAHCIARGGPDPETITWTAQRWGVPT